VGRGGGGKNSCELFCGENTLYLSLWRITEKSAKCKRGSGGDQVIQEFRK